MLGAFPLPSPQQLSDLGGVLTRDFFWNASAYKTPKG